MAKLVKRRKAEIREAGYRSELSAVVCNGSMGKPQALGRASAQLGAVTRVTGGVAEMSFQETAVYTLALWS